LRQGGTVTYSGVTAARLGWQVGVVTSGRCQDLAFGEDGAIASVCIPAERTTSFANRYRDGVRAQAIHARARRLAIDNYPAHWRGPTVLHLGPVADEIDVRGWASARAAFVGLTPQGWMRTWDGEGLVRPKPWDPDNELCALADAVVVSREDVGGSDERIEVLCGLVPVLAVTDGFRGARVYWEGGCASVRGYRVAEVDPTGAGDVFATAFFVRLARGATATEAATFANAVASLSVSGEGIEQIPSLVMAERWQKRGARLEG